jgi:glutaredoxin
MKSSIIKTAFCFVAVSTLLGLTATSAVAQAIYRIVGPDGRISFSDQPPPQSVKATALPPSGKSNASISGDLPYEVRQAANRFPVVLYSGDACEPCNSGRSMLNSRGIPFREYTVSSPDDIQAFQKQISETSLPVVTIGGQRIRGFVSSEWSQYLDAAGYPQVSQLPPSYRNPAPAPLASSSKPNQTTNNASDAPLANQPAPLPAVTPENPTGLVF